MNFKFLKKNDWIRKLKNERIKYSEYDKPNTKHQTLKTKYKRIVTTKQRYMARDFWFYSKE